MEIKVHLACVSGKFKIFVEIILLLEVFFHWLSKYILIFCFFIEVEISDFGTEVFDIKVIFFTELLILGVSEVKPL